MLVLIFVYSLLLKLADKQTTLEVLVVAVWEWVLSQDQQVYLARMTTQQHPEMCLAKFLVLILLAFCERGF